MTEDQIQTDLDSDLEETPEGGWEYRQQIVRKLLDRRIAQCSIQNGKAYLEFAVFLKTMGTNYGSFWNAFLEEYENGNPVILSAADEVLARMRNENPDNLIQKHKSRKHREAVNQSQKDIFSKEEMENLFQEIEDSYHESTSAGPDDSF